MAPSRLTPVSVAGFLSAEQVELSSSLCAVPPLPALAWVDAWASSSEPPADPSPLLPPLACPLLGFLPAVARCRPVLCTTLFASLLLLPVFISTLLALLLTHGTLLGLRSLLALWLRTQLRPALLPCTVLHIRERCLHSKASYLATSQSCKLRQRKGCPGRGQDVTTSTSVGQSVGRVLHTKSVLEHASCFLHAVLKLATSASKLSRLSAHSL